MLGQGKKYDLTFCQYIGNHVLRGSMFDACFISKWVKFVFRSTAHHTFIHGAKFYVDQPSSIEMTASCNEWINEGTGLSVLISIPHKVEPDNSIQPTTIASAD